METWKRCFVWVARTGCRKITRSRRKPAIPAYLSNHPNIEMWLNRHVMIAFTHMMLMAEVLGYDTAPMEGYEPEKVSEVLEVAS